MAPEWQHRDTTKIAFKTSAILVVILVLACVRGNWVHARPACCVAEAHVYSFVWVCFCFVVIVFVCLFVLGWCGRVGVGGELCLLECVCVCGCICFYLVCIFICLCGWVGVVLSVCVSMYLLACVRMCTYACTYSPATISAQLFLHNKTFHKKR